MPTTPEIQAAIDDAQRFYRSRVRTSWVFETLFSRNLADIIKPAEVGYAPAGWTTTTNHLLKAGHAEDTLAAAGISRRSSRGGLIDLMRDRMMFPIRDSHGIAGFTGRAAAEAGDDIPKYLNSPATERYDKTSALYGLDDKSAQQLRDGAWPIIVEGPLDRWAILKVAEAALPLVPLATCGTALTGQHLDALRAITHRPITLCFDGDPAGQAALMRAWDLLKEQMPRSPHRAITLPAGADPAQLVETRQRAQLLSAINHPEPLEQRAATIRASHHQSDHPLAVIAAARTTIEADVHAIPLTHVTPWIVHVANTHRLPVSEVNNMLLDSVSPEEDHRRVTTAPTSQHRGQR